jgi:hypothetical protein
MTACTMAGLGSAMWPLGMLAMIGFWGAVLWLGVRLFRGWGHGGAESTLARRFAEGDIDEHEYVSRLDALRAERSTFESAGRR